MARHRDVRAMNIDEEYEGYYDSAYGHSVEEEFCISPRTEAEFLYNRDAQKHSMSAFLGASPDSQLEECSGNEDSPRIRCDSVNESQNLSSIDRAKLQSCVEAMQNVVGDTVSENILIKAATENGFDVEKALDAVLSGSAFDTPKPPRSRKVVGTGKEFCIHRKYPTPDCKYWASKNSHHCRYNIKAIGYSSYLPIYDSLSLDLLKILIAFIESCPSSESQYCCKMCQKNDFASHLKTFYDSVVLFSTNFGSSELFVHRYRKMWNDLYLLIMDFQIEFETQERLRDGHVLNKTLSEKAFLCISKLLGFFSELLSESISLVSSKPSSFPCDEQLHLTKLLQIIQFHYPLTVLRSYTFTPSTASTSQLLCKDHSIQVLALPTKKVFKKQKYCPSVICGKLKSFSISFQFIASCFQLKSCQSLHTDQHYFVSRLTVPEGDCKHKVMKCVMPKGQNIFYFENMY